MTFTPRTARDGSRRLLAAVSLATAMTLAGCRGDTGGLSPDLPGNPAKNPQIRSAAFIVDVNTRTKKMTISAPVAVNNTPSVPTGAAAGGPDFSVASLVGPNFSIIAGDAVELSASGYTASAVGAFQPGRVRVSFDVNISNRLNGVELITSTFPAPPAGVTGVLLFPYETVVTTTSGGTTVTGDGTEIIVEQPNYGAVNSSVDWDGSPHNFFNDTGCPAGSNDCYRYETYTQPLSPGATSEAHRVGFDIDPTVGNFRARLIVAADLHNAGASPTGTVAGAVTSPQLGALTGVTVTVNTGGFTGTTGAGGAYSIGSVNIGPRTVSVTGGLPAGCTTPASQAITVSNGATSTVNFSVTCPVPSGTISGTISSSLGGGISGVSVTVTPNALPAMAPVSTGGTGLYSVGSVPVAGTGTGTLTLSNLPALCTNPGALPYGGLTNGGTITVNVTVACTAPAAGYQYSNTWSAPAGGQVTLTISINMGTYNDPAINGAAADDIETITGHTTYNSARLQFVSAVNVVGSTLQNGIFNGSNPGVVHWTQGNTNAALATGVQGIAVITFNVVAGAPAVTTGSTFDEALSRGSNDLLPRIVINEGVLP